MASQIDRETRARQLWRLTDEQHGVVSTDQLLDRGYTRAGISHRVAAGRLHRRARGVYAVGRPELSRHGEMMVAVLACSPGAVVSHETAAELWGLRRREYGPVEVSVPRSSPHRRPGIVAHRRSILDPRAVTTRESVPTTIVPLTLIDLASRLPGSHLERAVNLADSLDLLAPDRLHGLLARFPYVAGVAILRRLLEREAFRLPDSELERMFLALMARTSLSTPLTQRYASGHRVDFVWVDLGLVVETDSLRYHRTALQQRRDAARDHAHLLAGRQSVRFTHYQVAHEQAHVLRTLEAAHRRASR